MSICEFNPNNPDSVIKCNTKRAISRALRMEVFRGFSPDDIREMLCSSQTTESQRFQDCPALPYLISFGRDSEFAISPLSDPDFL